MDPNADRRNGDDRRHDGLTGFALKALQSPVGIILLLGTFFVSAVNFVDKAKDSLPASTYYGNREIDSIVTANARAGTAAQLTEIQAQVAEVRIDLAGERASMDSIKRLLRHSICRQNPEECP